MSGRWAFGASEGWFFLRPNICFLLLSLRLFSLDLSILDDSFEPAGHGEFAVQRQEQARANDNAICYVGSRTR